MKLRDYQRRAVRNVEAEWKRGHRNVLLVSPTGSGKSVMGAAIVKRHGGHVLWVAHRVELLLQARAELLAIGVAARDVGIISGSVRENEDARVLLASIDVMRGEEVAPVDLVVIDEAHRSEALSYRDLLEHYDVPALGLTATPSRLDRKPLGDTYDEMVVAATIAELEDAGHVARPITYGIPLEKAKALVAGLKGKDYSPSELSRRMGSKRLLGDVVSETQRLAPGQRTIVFAVSREHGRELAKRFSRAGRRTAYLDGKTPDAERTRIVRDLQVGSVEVVVNVDVLTEGFDCPAVQCVAIARPTKSLTRFLQYCGRAVRPWGKARPTILDHGGNCWRFGLPNDTREWSLDGPPLSASTGDAPLKQCVVCEEMIPAGCRRCPECDSEQPRDPKELEEERRELERLQDEREKKAIAREKFKKLAEVADMSAVKMSTEEWVEMMVRENWRTLGDQRGKGRMLRA